MNLLNTLGLAPATLAAQLAAEKAAFLALIGSAEQLEGVRAFNEKREPGWAAQDDD